MVCVINDQVHAGKAYYLMQLIAAFVDVTPFGHEGADIITQFLDALGELPAVISHW